VNTSNICSLVCKYGVWVHEPENGKHYKIDLDLHVTDATGSISQPFELMCAAIHEDVQTAKGSGACLLEWISRVESGELDMADVDGNAWVMYITREKVWFEGLYDQGEGGAVTFDQFKLAVETYIRFLADPEGKTIEVPFPAA